MQQRSLKPTGRRHIKTLIVYDSLYGNTKAVAAAIAAVLTGNVSLAQIGQVSPGQLGDVDLLIIGSPTHGALPSQAMKAWLEKLGPPDHERARAATFDTRLTWPFLERWGGFAAPKMAGSLREKGWSLVVAPGGFFVRGLRKGPLKAGELEPAAAWAREIAQAAAQEQAQTPSG